MYHEHQTPIWFFIGLLLSVYGVLILGYGIYNAVYPPEHPVKLAYLHADIWWSILLLAIGLIYSIKHWPSKMKE
jgi:DMSO reductase anchor subunit